MKTTLQRLGSTRATPWLFALLGVAVVFAHVDVRLPDTAVALPLALLGTHLACAMAVRPRLRHGGLGLFHASLLACLLLLAWGRLAHFEGRVEVADGQPLDAQAVQATAQGPWHDPARLGALRFVQQAWHINYAAGVKRADTQSQVTVDDQPRTVGDDRALVLDGYRFYTTHNKGFAPLLTWQAPGAAPVSGHIHMPSWPLFDWKQLQDWTPPAGPPMKLWVHPDGGLPTDRAFTLAPSRMAATLVLEVAGTRHSLRPGDEASGPWGRLRFERLQGWMGYRIHRDPAMLPLLWLSLAGVLGLAWHLAPRMRRLLAPAAERPAAATAPATTTPAGHRLS